MQTGKRMSVDEIVADARRYKSYMKFSGGGVTVTGGEPLSQLRFLEVLLSEIKAAGFHTAIDTSGYAPGQNLSRVLANTDLVLLDIKSINPETYKAVTGVRIDSTLNMLETCREMGRKVWVRFVLVPGLTDDIDDMRRLAEYLKPYENVERVEVVPFHKVGEYKWRDLGLEYELDDVRPPGNELLDVARVILGR